MPKIRILIADDHALVRSGLKALLAAQPDLEVVGEAADGATVIDECRRRDPDVVLMDLTMPGRGGVAAIQDLQRFCPRSKTLVVTMHEDEAYMRQARLAGASGYVLKKALASELIGALRDVHQGRPHFASSPADPDADSERPLFRFTRFRDFEDALSPREKEVVGNIALGHTTSEIADLLHISPKTVETHRQHIAEKLNLHTRADLVRFAIEFNLMPA